jgi:TetR/AcrR family transcriptional regulator
VHSTAPSRTQSDRSDLSRQRILDAALLEFSAEGLAGARTDRIAAAAGVNKALIYYYFESKENLYNATLEMIASRVRDSTMAVFLRSATAGERILRFALNHFDRILSQRDFQNLMQQEMIRVHKGESGAVPLLIQRVFAPTHAMFQSLVREGIASGELIEADWFQFPLVALGANVFYFLAAPIWGSIMPFDPFSPAVIAERRFALVRFLGQALFLDRQHGARLAEQILADTPMPEIAQDRFLHGRKNERT